MSAATATADATASKKYGSLKENCSDWYVNWKI